MEINVFTTQRANAESEYDWHAHYIPVGRPFTKYVNDHARRKGRTSMISEIIQLTSVIAGESNRKAFPRGLISRPTSELMFPIMELTPTEALNRLDNSRFPVSSSESLNVASKQALLASLCPTLGFGNALSESSPSSFFDVRDSINEYLSSLGYTLTPLVAVRSDANGTGVRQPNLAALLATRGVNFSATLRPHSRD